MMQCQNCGRPVAGPAFEVKIEVKRAVVHEDRIYSTSCQRIDADLLICRACTGQGLVDLGQLFKAVGNGLAKTTGG